MNKEEKNKNSNRYIIFGIFFIATILRFFDFFNIPFVDDEFSALFRTQFNSFSELIEKGVIVDGHPPLIQVFLYYWIKIFGSSEWIVKLPFLLFGLLSIYYIYLIGKKWFNETVGLISAAFLASLQFTVMWSQIARPYISGLFFSLAMVYYLSLLVSNPEKRYLKNSILYILFASLCSYNHHFSLLFTAIVGLTGLFLIQKKYILKYFLNAAIIMILYIPNIPIVLYQLKIGGIESWLAKPTNDFIFNYISYIFQFSPINFLIIAGIIIFGFLKRQKINVKMFVISALWFLLPFLIGFYYSRYVSAVLQYSVLIFSFPFLFFVLFGHLKVQKPIINAIIVTVILATNIYSLVFERQHYTIFYNSPWEKILENHEIARKKFGNVISIIDSQKKIINFINDKKSEKSQFIWFDSISDTPDLKSFLSKQVETVDYLYFGFMSGNDANTVAIIQEYFPTIVQQDNYFIATTYLFSKEKDSLSKVISKLDFESSERDIWWNSFDNSKITDSISFSNPNSYIIDSLTEYSPTFSKQLNEIIDNRYNFIDISVKVFVPERHSGFLVISSLDSNEKNIYWSGTPLDNCITDDDIGKWITIHHSVKLSDIYLEYKNIQFKAYVWNQGRQNFVIDDFTIRLRDGNPIVYGLFNKIK